MKDDPYSALIEVMKDEQPPITIQIGTVIQPPPNLVLQVGDLQIDKDNIVIADYLLNGYKRKIKIPETPVTGLTNDINIETHGSHKHQVEKIGINEVEVSFLDTLTKDDELAVLPTVDKQEYFVLCKVVRL